MTAPGVIVLRILTAEFHGRAIQLTAWAAVAALPEDSADWFALCDWHARQRLAIELGR